MDINVATIELDVIIKQMLILYLLAAVGYVAAKSKLFPGSFSTSFSKLILRVTMPCTILAHMMEHRFTFDQWMNGIKLTFVSLTFIMMALGISCLTTKMLKLPMKTADIYKIQSMFGNVIFLAYPLLTALFGSMGELMALFFNIGNDILLWTLGIYLAGRHKKEPFKNNIIKIVNPNTLAFILGTIFMLTGIGPGLLETIPGQALNTIGGLTSPLAMIFIGIALAGVRFRDFRGKFLGSVALLSLQKLLVVPLLALFIMLPFKNFLGHTVIVIGVMQLAMPVGTATVSIAAEYESDEKFASASAMMTALAVLGTMPLIILVLKAFL